MQKNESLLDILVLLYKWKKQIIIATFLSAVITAGVSLLLPNFYKASTQFYAASPDLAKPTPIGSVDNDLKIYGSDEDIDRLLSISKSSEVKDYLITEYDLYNHYDIDPDSKNAKHKLLLKLNKLYETTKTKYDAINLSVEDEDINLSAQMANAAREKISEIAKKIIKQSQVNLIKSYESNIEAKSQYIQTLTDSIFYLRSRYKIFNTASQGEAYGSSIVEISGKLENTKAQISYLQNNAGPRDSIKVLQSKLNGFQKQYNLIKSDIENYNSGYPYIITLERDIKAYGEQLSISMERLKQLQSAYNNDFSTIHLIEKAEVPVYKSRPKRSIIVVGIAMLTFIIASLWVILQDQFTKNNWKEEFRNA
jgi:uncharacterized protein involved in exopolysaccharide biosynthesis